MMNIKFINATSVQLVDQAGNTVQNVGEFSSPTEFSYSGNSFSKNEKNYYHFAITGTNVQLSGSIGDVTEGYQYWNLFKGQTAITNASNLTLDATTLKDWCYANMFLDCTNLTTPPIISGTSLARWCCQGMFAGCNSLTAAPILPATTLAQNCYYAMFYGCKSLSASPYLPATTLVPWCYTSMFYNCQNLTSISANFNSWTPSTATKNWVTRIDTEGTFYNNNVDFIYGDDNVPDGWEKSYSAIPLTFKSVGDTAVSIKNSNLSYKKNNGNWTQYTSEQAIELTNDDVVSFSGTNTRMAEDANMSAGFSTSGTGSLFVYGNPHSLINYGNLIDFAFCDLFARCGNIVDASNVVLSATSLAQDCYRGLFSRNTSLTASPNLPATGLASQCYYSMFSHCYALSTAPELSATTLVSQCYMHMFNSCSSLFDAPILPASTLATGSYDYMFSGCTSLTSINVNFTEWGNSTNWVNNVAPTGIFTKPEALTARVGYNYVPYNWNVVNK